MTNNDAAAVAAFDPRTADAGQAGADLNLDVILDVPVSLSLEVGRARIPIRNLLQLNQGSVVELERGAGEPLDVYVTAPLIAQGEVVVVNDRFGVRLTDIVSPSERIKTCGGGAAGRGHFAARDHRRRRSRHRRGRRHAGDDGPAPGARAVRAAAPGPGVAGSLGGAVLALVLVVGLILALSWLARRIPGLGGTGGHPGLRIVGARRSGRATAWSWSTWAAPAAARVGAGSPCTPSTSRCPTPPAPRRRSPSCWRNTWKEDAMTLPRAHPAATAAPPPAWLLLASLALAAASHGLRPGGPAVDPPACRRNRCPRWRSAASAASR